MNLASRMMRAFRSARASSSSMPLMFRKKLTSTGGLKAGSMCR